MSQRPGQVRCGCTALEPVTSTLAPVTTVPAAARYRRRRRWPVLLVVVVLMAGAGFVWFQALKPGPVVAGGCNKPGPAPATTVQTSRSAARTTTFGGAPSTTGRPVTASSASATTTPTSLGVFTDKNTLASVRPANPSFMKVNVFNASKQRGIAKTLSDEMRRAGFESITEVANDPLYPAQDLRCLGQIRYGNAGVGSARTALIMLPCAQLVVDDRVDDSVDIAVGNRFEFADTPDAVKSELRSIRQAAIPPAVIDEKTAASRSILPIPPLPTATCPS